MSQNMMKVSTAFRSYRECGRNNTLVQNMLRIFDGMTEYILRSQSIDYNFDLLHQLSLINKEGAISQSPEEYHQAKEFRKFFRTYSQYVDVKNRSVEVVESIIRATRPLILDAKVSIYRFIWSLPGFRKSLIKMTTTKDEGTPFNGADYTTDSIFSPILSAHKREYTSNRNSYKAFKSLTDKMERAEFDSVFGYLMKIVLANRAYTYDQVQTYAHTLSTYELLGTVLILITKLIQNNQSYIFAEGTVEIKNTDENAMRTNVWNLIDILYFTVFEIKRSTAESYKYNNDELLRLTNEFGNTHDTQLTPRIQQRRRLVDEGKSGLERLVEIVRLLDVKFIDSIIFANAYSLLETMETSVIFRLRRYILERNIKKGTALSSFVCRFTHRLLQTRIPPQLKSEFLRLVMAYNLHTEYVEIGANEVDTSVESNPYLEVLTTYLLTDARKLGDTALMHALDVLDHFSGFLFIVVSPDSPSYSRCVKITRLYLGYLKSITELYSHMVRSFLNVPDHIKPNIIQDMMSVSGYCKDLVLMVSQIGNEALEYIDPLLHLIEKVVNTKDHMNIPDQTDPDEISVIDQVRPTYISKFRPLLLQMLKRLDESSLYVREEILSPITDEWRAIYSMYYIDPRLAFSESVFRLILRSDSIKILRDLFDIDLDRENIQHLVVSSDLSDLNISSSILDGITYDLIVSPVAIPIGTGVEEVIIVNQRTLHTILLEGINPFTRQPLNYDEVIEINKRPDVVAMLDSAMNTIRGLTT